MNAFEVYKMFLALSHHFKGRYDYFKYNGAVRASVDSFEKRRDKIHFINISTGRTPKDYLIGNFLYSDTSWVGNFKKENELKYKKEFSNSQYIFTEDLKKMGADLRDALYPSEDPVPKIVELYQSDDISLLTMCIMEKLFSLKSKWERNEYHVIYKDVISKVGFSVGFFDIPTEKYKKIIYEQFKK